MKCSSNSKNCNYFDVIFEVISPDSLSFNDATKLIAKLEVNAIFVNSSSLYISF